MWINLKSGYTFKKVYGHLGELAKISAGLCKANGFTGAGIVDIDNTFSHIRWRTACEKVGINPIYGVALPVTTDLQRGERRYPFNYMSFIALNTEGLQEIYELVKIAHDQFYYRPRVVYAQVNALSSDVVVLSGVAPDWSQIKREVLFELSPSTPISQRGTHNPIACVDNYYPTPEDRAIYEPFADDRSRESKTTDMHILSMEEWIAEFGNLKAVNKLKEINDDAWVDLPEAHMVKYIGSDDIEAWCRLGAAKRGLDITQGEYKERYDREMKLIIDKDYVDYFLVTADLIRYAKTKMAVGHARGSSAGSLVCYLMGITEVDPLEYDLYFERFIDINRFDLPDIDIDFQDDKRHLVLKYLEKKYGKDCVAQLGNVNTMKPKSAIAKFAQAFAIPMDETQELKDAIIERSGGDARAAFCMEDTFNDSHVGQAFIKKHPEMKTVSKIEQHPSHTGVHAAGILVCNEPITEYCGVNTRDKKQIAMLDKKDAEKINLLKIDALGLRTLSILASVCDQLGKPYGWLYDIALDDDKAYAVFNDHRYSGIFQFEGPAIKGLAAKMPVENIEDISALGALGRPGPLMSGGANDYIKYRNGAPPEYLSKHKSVIDSTESTFGVVIYQEQMLSIGREYGQLSWEDVCQLRKAASKSLGDEFFGKYEDAFIEGAMEQGESEEDAKAVWKGICSMGSWGFNKSHSVSYGLISYLCAYMKGNHPLEFTVACLNHSKDDNSAIKILRDAVESENIVYEFFNREHSERDWCVKAGILYGGHISLPGIGPAKANKILKARREFRSLTPALEKSVSDPSSIFQYLYPAKEVYGDYYDDNDIQEISSVQTDGEFTILGKLIKKNLRDLNEASLVAKRNGEYKTGETTWLNITLEDDTGEIMCKINTKDYEQIGRVVAETGKEDKDWYAVRGKRINGWSLIFVTNIFKITR